jgi:peptidoglycan/LPS O-acetylase OafA/YrhL
MNRGRLVTVSVVQFFASVFIMLRHYAFFIKAQFPAVASALSNVTFSDFFFCCSGFFLHYVNVTKNSAEIGPILRKRLFKLYPLHLATTLFYVGILVISAYVGSLGSTRSSWDCVLPTITLTHAFGIVDRQCLNYPSWFLSALFAMYIVYHAAGDCEGRRRTRRHRHRDNRRRLRDCLSMGRPAAMDHTDL